MNVMKKISATRGTDTCSISDRKSELSDASSSRRMKMRFKMKMRMMSNLGMSSMVSGSKGKTVVYENTYKTEPEDNRHFSRTKAEQIIYSVLETYLAQREYDAKRFPSLSKTLSELIKDRMKDLGLERYKLVAVVTLCENRDQGTRVASRCLWNPQYDNHASVVYEGANFFALVTPTRVASRCLWNPQYDNHASVVYEGANVFAVGSVYAVYFY